MIHPPVSPRPSFPVPRLRPALLFFALLVLTAGCDRAAEPVAEIVEIEFATGAVTIEAEDTVYGLRVEIAQSPAQRAQGLMRRTSLDEDAGMIFLFDEEQPADGVFWMFNTLIPLSIAFLDSGGAIVSIRDMEPCTSPYPQWCPTYESGMPFHAALEVSRGYFEARGIGLGDRVALQPD